MLAKRKYVAIGEFHIYGADADLPNMRGIVQLAKKFGLFLHSHSDSDAVTRHFQQDPDARVLWAHSGFERPEKVREMLRKYPTLYCDLAFLTAHASNGKVAPGLARGLPGVSRPLRGRHRYFTPERWHYVVEHARWSRAWLADLPPDVARRSPTKTAIDCSAAANEIYRGPVRPAVRECRVGGLSARSGTWPRASWSSPITI
jgi:hypothetical protein